MAATRRRWTRWDRVRLVLAAGALLGGLVAHVNGQWTAGATATATFSTGTIDLRLGAAPGVDDLPAETTVLTSTDLVPGSAVTATLPVRNAGTVPITYSVTTVAGGALATGLRLSVYPGGTCSGAAIVADVPLAGAAFGPRALTGTGGALPVETLCFRVALDPSAGNSLQGTTATATFTFTAVSA